MYYVGGRNLKGSITSRPDCVGMGPAATQPWAEMSMRWWLARVPASKLVMGVPAYSNDYSALPFFGGANGSQAGIGPPSSEPCRCPSDGCPGPCRQSSGPVETIWEFDRQSYTYMYTDTDGRPRIRYGTEVESTKALLRTATKLGVDQVGFWTFNLADEAMVNATLEWASGMH